MRFDCDQRSVRGFLSHLDSLDWYIDSYLSAVSDEEMEAYVIDGWMKHYMCLRGCVLYEFVCIQ